MSEGCTFAAPRFEQNTKEKPVLTEADKKDELPLSFETTVPYPFGTSNAGVKSSTFGTFPNPFGGGFDRTKCFGSEFGTRNTGVKSFLPSGFGGFGSGGSINPDRWIAIHTPRLFDVLRTHYCFMPDNSSNLQLLLEIENYLFVAQFSNMSDAIACHVLEKTWKQVKSKECLRTITSIVTLVWCNESMEFHYNIIKTCMDAIVHPVIEPRA